MWSVPPSPKLPISIQTRKCQRFYLPEIEQEEAEEKDDGDH